MKILVSEDDSVSRRMLEALLKKWGYDAVTTGDGLEAWDILQRDDRPQIAILDWLMPGMDGAEICRAIRKQTGKPYLYIVLLSSKTDRQDILEGLEAGADDYVVKPFDNQELRLRLRSGMRILQLEAELISAREALKELASIDELTSLLNRHAFIDLFQREIDRARRESRRLTLIMADIDHFKNVNDTLGHLAGDAVLRSIAQTMRQSVRSYDMIGRYGGEEFLILLVDCDQRNAWERAEEIRHRVGNQAILAADPQVFITPTISLGLAVMHGDSFHRDIYTLIHAADRALYRAKRGGRNRCEVANEMDLSM